MRKILQLGVFAAAVALLTATTAFATGDGRADRVLPFTFFLTHYELLGDPNNPTGVRYHNNGRPFASTPDGSATLTLSGRGGWDPAGGRVAGGGTYTITNASGTITERGAWRVTSFVSFLQLPGWWGIPGFRERGWQGPPGSPSFSGFLTLRVTVANHGDAELVAWCLMPTVPKPGDHVSDGISLVGSGLNFVDYHASEMTLEGVMFYGPGG